MKVRIIKDNKEKQFKPFKLELEIDTLKEVLLIWCLFNCEWTNMAEDIKNTWKEYEHLFKRHDGLPKDVFNYYYRFLSGGYDSEEIREDIDHITFEIWTAINDELIQRGLKES